MFEIQREKKYLHLGDASLKGLDRCGIGHLSVYLRYLVSQRFHEAGACRLFFYIR